MKQDNLKTETQFVEEIAAIDLLDDSGCENAWEKSVAYLKCYPKGNFLFDVLVAGEVSKAALAYHRVKNDPEPDYSLCGMRSHESARDILVHGPDPSPRELRTGFQVMPLEHAEFEALASRAEVKATAEELKKGSAAFNMLINSYSETIIGQIKKRVTDKYHKKLINGKSKAKVQGLSRDDLVERAEIYYAAYQNNDFHLAASSCRDLIELDPLEPYNHNLLFAIYHDLGEHKQALEEILYANKLDPSDLKIKCNLVMMYRRLGLYVEAMNYFAGIAGSVPEPLDSNDSNDNYLISTLRLERHLAFLVYWGFINHLFHLALNSDQGQGLRYLASELEKKKDERDEQEEQLVQSLEGTSIFISYRRQDSGDQVDRLCELLHEQLPDVEIFRDITDISVGQGWLVELERAIEKADILLAIIGKKWTGRLKSGNRRLDDRNDVLRRELALALGQDRLIIPVVVNDASMPKSKDIPSELRAIRQTQAISLKPASLSEDSARLISELRRILKLTAKERRERIKEVERVGLGNLKIDLEHIYVSDINFEGRWECKLKTSEGKGTLLFTVKHNSQFEGTWEPADARPMSIHGNFLQTIDENGQWLHGWVLEGITDDVEPFVVKIPIDKSIGEGYYGTDESGGSYFLRLIERTKEGL